MNYYKRHIGDYQSNTADLCALEHGIYSQLLDFYYSQEKPLTNDLTALCRVSRIDTQSQRSIVLKIADRYFPLGDDGFRHNKRADEEIIQYRLKADKNKANGLSGGRPKANPIGNPKITQTVSETEPKRNLIQNPLTTNQYSQEVSSNEDTCASKSKRFVKPALSDVGAYCEQRGNLIDPQAFMDHYEANGWKVGRNPMKDWRATVRTWEQSRPARASPRKAMSAVERVERANGMHVYGETFNGN